MSLPVRYTDKSFPEYAFIPGKYPHPRSHPDGHSYNKAEKAVDAMDSKNFAITQEYLYGIDLFNYGYYWEAHEAWEAVWKANGKEGTIANFLKALIKLTASSVKILQQQPTGIRDHALAAQKIFNHTKETVNDNIYLGLSLNMLIDFTGFIYSNSEEFKVDYTVNPQILFDRFLELKVFK